MGSPKPREKRQVVVLPARMRVTQEWCEITICNVSPRGFMAKCPDPPPRGSYVDVRRGQNCIVARVVWSQGVRFGARSQDTIDLPTLREQSPRTAKGNDERRTAARGSRTAPAPPSVHARADNARRIGRLLDWWFVVFAVVMAGALVAEVAGSAMSDPLQQARDALRSTSATPGDNGNKASSR